MKIRDAIPPNTLRAMFDLAKGAETMKGHEHRHKYVHGVTKDVDPKAGTITSIISTDEVDRDGEVIAAGAFDDSIKGYMKNPVVLYGHNSWEPPIGKCISLETVKAGLQAVTEFAREVYDFADLVFRLYEGKFLRAWSVGFMPLKWINFDAIEEPAEGQRGPTFIKAELFEYSAVPLPSNRGALTELAKGVFAPQAPRPNLDALSLDGGLEILRELESFSNERMLSPANRKLVDAAREALNALAGADDDGKKTLTEVDDKAAIRRSELAGQVMTNLTKAMGGLLQSANTAP